MVPVRNEAPGVARYLASLQVLRAQGYTVIVVDGGSDDATAEIAAPLCDALLHAPAGRASQMNAGARHGEAEVLLFLHADTLLPANAIEQVKSAINAGALWGRFDVTIQGRSRWLPLIGAMMNLRSRFTGIATGDQAIFVRRDTFESLGGFATIPLMEDIELCKRLRALAWPACLHARVQTSGRRWDERGALRTMLLMWRLRWRYWRGESAQHIAEAYR
ncbi:MAG: TIGR04283 family arsenosugar biosynthesis glycosyltransferase [Rhodoferax sp.]|nr:TIGR04283 family arsenosugar biosynthesis glycosyltransferase [Rhodoferax sp.]